MDTKLDIRTENELRKIERRKVLKAFNTILDDTYRWSVEKPIAVLDNAKHDDLCEALEQLDVEEIAYVISELARKARDYDYYESKNIELSERVEDLEGRISHLKDILDGD